MGSKTNRMERYVAAMVLSGVGDAMGYKNGNWEFCHSGEMIHTELKELGGVDKLHIDKKKWMVSDDTVMHLATGEALLKHDLLEDKDRVYTEVAQAYKDCMRDMAGRAPGPTTMNSCHKLKPGRPQGYRIPFDPRGGGCGGAMRAMCIGLAYSEPEDIHNLIAVSIESGRMTHNHPTGYLGAMASALFTSYSLQSKPLIYWGVGLLKTVDLAKEYIQNTKVDVNDNLKSWDYFTDSWTKYLEQRNLKDGKSEPVFPEKYGVKERDAFYKSLSYAGWGGASGHDAPMIAYDALLSTEAVSNSGLDWRELCSRSMFHSGDSDSTGVIAGCCYGAMFGFEGVKECNYEHLEYRSRLVTVGKKLYDNSERSKQTLSEMSLSADSEDQSIKSDTKSDATGVDSVQEHITDTQIDGTEDKSMEHVDNSSQ